MNLFKKLIMIGQSLFVVCNLSIVAFCVTGCEHGGDDNQPAVTNVVNNTGGGGGSDESVTNNQTASSNNGGDNGGNSNPPPGPTKEVVVSNTSSIAVPVTFNTKPEIILSSSNSMTWTYSGGKFDITIDDVPRTVTDGLNHLYNIYDGSVAGTVDVRGSSY